MNPQPPQRIRFNRSMFTVPLNGQPPREMVDELVAEDIELIIDIRMERSDEDARAIDELCELAAIYYVYRATMDDDTTTWAAGLALRHRTCVVGDPDESRLATSAAIAKAAGMRVIDIEASPAPITRTARGLPPKP